MTPSSAARPGFMVLLVALVTGAVSALFAGEPAPKTPIPALTGSPALIPPRGSGTNLPVRALPDGRWQIGEVFLDRRERTVTFPAVVNMDHALVEYLVVSAGGKTHESVLRAEARAFDVHIAMLLLGARAATTSNPAIFYDPKQKVPGDEVDLELRWREGERTIRKSGEELIFDLGTKQRMSRGPWVYNGSQVLEGRFVAEREGSIVALMSDPYALVNNPRIGHENDSIWLIDTNAVPKLGTPVEVTIRLK